MPLSRFYIPSPTNSTSQNGNCYDNLLNIKTDQIKIKPGKIFKWISAIAIAADPVLWTNVMYGLKHMGALISLYTKS